MLGKESDQDPIKTFYFQLQGPLLPWLFNGYVNNQLNPVNTLSVFLKIYLFNILFQNTPKVPHILVIGGGVVGITSALQLLNKG